MTWTTPIPIISIVMSHTSTVCFMTSTVTICSSQWKDNWAYKKILYVGVYFIIFNAETDKYFIHREIRLENYSTKICLWIKKNYSKNTFIQSTRIWVACRSTLQSSHITNFKTFTIFISPTWISASHFMIFHSTSCNK